MPKLYLFIGYPGAGKTTIAQLIQQRTGAVHLWADVKRHEMFPNPTHTEAESLKLYNHLNQRTADLLAQGRSVIFDTNFNHRRDRDHLREIARQNNASLVIIWVNTPLETAKLRAVHSDMVRNNYDVVMSEAQFDGIATKLEQPTEDEKVIKIDGTEIDPETVVRLLNL